MRNRNPSAATPYVEAVAALVERRLPLAVESAGREDDWNLVGPALLAAATRHLRALDYLHSHLRSAVVGWQVLRSMFEYVTTFAWIAADPGVRVRRWLKYDYGQRFKVDNDLASLGEERILDRLTRERLAAYAPDSEVMPKFVDIAREADDAWAEVLRVIEGQVPEDVRRFRLQYVWIYRNGSRFTHPSSHVVNPFIGGAPPRLVIGEERPLERDLPLIGTALLALGLTVAAEALPEMGLTHNEIAGALA